LWILAGNGLALCQTTDVGIPFNKIYLFIMFFILIIIAAVNGR